MKINWPIGTPEERAAANGKLPGQWKNSNPFANWYEISPGVRNYHDGVDLNLNAPSWNGRTPSSGVNVPSGKTKMESP